MRRFISSQAKKQAKAAILDGKGISKAWQEELKDQAKQLEAKLGRKPGLAFVNVGDRDDSRIYIQHKEDACKRVGIWSTLESLPSNATQTQLENKVRHLCSQQHIDGLLVQLPLPSHLDEEAVIDAFQPSKDVDGFHPLNVGRLIMRDRQKSMIPCTALGCMELLHRSGIELQGKEAVIIGDSNVVGTPLAMLLRNSGIAAFTLCSRPSMQAVFEDRQDASTRADMETCLPALPGLAVQYRQGEEFSSGGEHSSVDDGENDGTHQGNTHSERDSATFDLQTIARRADILVVAVGKPEVVKADWIKPGAVVLDVGINVVPDGEGGSRVVGDVAFQEVSQVAAAITPVPGGMGPMTIAALMHNTIQAAKACLTDNSEQTSYAAQSA